MTQGAVAKLTRQRSGQAPAAIGMMSNETALGALAMALLVFQGTALSLTLRYSRTQEGPHYLASVAVIYTEAIKLVICLAAQMLLCRRSAKEHTIGWRKEFNSQFADILSHSLPMALPAALFVMQQVLVIIAASHLDAVTFQIGSQSFKILPTALFAAWLLGQRLSAVQWASLPVLAAGVILITLNGSSPGPGAKNSGTQEDYNLVVGLSASAASGLSSAYAGVYFEKYVKGGMSRSLTVRNLQLSLYGLPFSMAYMWFKDGMGRHNLSQGFDLVVWSVVGLQVFGGLIVAMVVKYADNILKNFANALAVVFTVLGAIPLFGQYPSGFFLLGAALVTVSVTMYGATAEQSAAWCSKASVCLSPVWLQRVRDSRVVAFLKSAAGPVISYAAALLLALGCTATIFLVIAAKTQSIPLYSREGGLQLVSAGELQLNGTNGSWHAKTLHL